MEYIKCRKSDCFGNFCGTYCRVLSKPIVGKACPFYKTIEENENDRIEAMDRLVAIGCESLMGKYAIVPD